jgi:hypothetical protein
VIVRVKLSAAWASLMFCYIYADYFSLFEKGRLATMNRGLIPPLGEATDGTMLFVSAMMAVPSLMIFLSVVLPRQTARWLNIAVGFVYAAIIAAIMRDSTVLLFFGVIEIGLTVAIITMAWRLMSERATS